jgi:hypothetical protein
VRVTSTALRPSAIGGGRAPCCWQLFGNQAGRSLQLLVIYLILCMVRLGLGTSLLFAPDGLIIFSMMPSPFSRVEPEVTFKKLFYRMLGVGFMAVSVS